MHNALKPIAPSVPSQRPLKILKTREEQWAVLESFDDETKAEFKSIKTADEAKAWLASKGYGMA